MKKTLNIFVLIILTTFLNINFVNAKEIEKETIITYDNPIYSNINDNENGLSSTKPSYQIPGVSTYSQDVPSKKWNLHTKGQLDISGYSSNNDLYTNYYLTGVSNMNIYLELIPYIDNQITVYFYRARWSILKDELVDTFVVKSGQQLTRIYKNLDSGSDYYFKFIHPCHFNGYIKEGN